MTSASADPRFEAEPESLDVPAVVRRWSTTCQADAFGGTDLIFRDPPGLVAAALGASASATGTTAFNLFAAQGMLGARALPSLVVLQMIALGRAVHAEAERLDAQGRSMTCDRLDRAINTAIAHVIEDLERQGLVDSLTGLLNRRALQRDLTEVLRASARNNRCVVVAMVDIDGLKATNDKFGHAAGDDRLRALARELVRGLRTGDNVYRIGGDEFVLLLPELEPDNLHSVLDRVDHETTTPATWGCAWGRAAGVHRPQDLGPRLLALADRRLITQRTLDSSNRHPEPRTIVLSGRFSAGSKPREQMG